MAVRIPTEASGYTRQWLAYLDSNIEARTKLNRTTKRDEANELIAHADGEVYYFATLYARLLQEDAPWPPTSSP